MYLCCAGDGLFRRSLLYVCGYCFRCFASRSNGEPPTGSQFAGDSVTFNWTTGTDVSRYWLYIGTSPAKSDLLNVSTGLNRTVTVTGLPTTGIRVYVTLWSMVGNGWVYNSYQYITANSGDLAPAAGNRPPVQSRSDANANGTCWNDFAGAAYHFRSWLCTEDDYGTARVLGTVPCGYYDCIVVQPAVGSTLKLDLLSSCYLPRGSTVTLYRPNGLTGSGEVRSGYGTCRYRSASYAW